MPIVPILTFKAGLCDLDESTSKVRPLPTPGYVYLYSEDDLLHFCWRPRSALLENAELDLVMVPTDGNFSPYQKSRVAGRIFVLRFSSSSQRHLFWMQSKSQSPAGDPSFFSAKDLKIAEVVNDLLQGEDVDVEQAIVEMRAGHAPNEDEDEEMEDVEGIDHDRGAGGAGAGATGGDIREEGEESREGGADGGRATGEALDARTIIQNFIRSVPGASGRGAPQQKLFTTLQDLLTPAITTSWIETASEHSIDQLMQYLPSNLTALSQDTESDQSRRTTTLSLPQKKELVKRVLRSPQFAQSLASLTFALRDGGLPSIGEALNIPLQNGGYMRRGGVPLGGGEAVEAFLNGVKDAAEKDDEDDMDEDK